MRILTEYQILSTFLKCCKTKSIVFTGICEMSSLKNIYTLCLKKLHKHKIKFLFSHRKN